MTTVGLKDVGRCPSCRYALNAHEAITEGPRSAPEDGDYMVCGGCGIILTVEQGHARTLTVEEFAAMEPEHRRELEAGQKVMREFQAFKRGTLN